MIQAGPRGPGFWVAHFQRTIHPEVNQNPGTIGLVNDPQVPILHVAVVHLDGVYPIEAVDAVQKEVESVLLGPTRPHWAPRGPTRP